MMFSCLMFFYSFLFLPDGFLSQKDHLNFVFRPGHFFPKLASLEKLFCAGYQQKKATAPTRGLDVFGVIEVMKVLY